MRKKISLFFVVALMFTNVYAQTSKHIVLISIDGFRPDFYLEKNWPVPNLQILMKQGVYADHMKSVFPSYTYPAHTAMLTGAYPARSGIYFNQPKGSKGEWNWFTSPIKVPTLWQVLKKDGLATAAVQWPVSVDSSITYDIPEIWDNDHPDDRITTTRKYATPGLIEEIEDNATGKLDSNNMNDNYFSLDENAGRMAGYILKTKKPALLAVHFACVDGEQHEYGRDGDSVRLALASADRAIGEIMEAIDQSGMRDSTTVIIVGDHGFCDINTVFRPNMLITDLPARFTPSGGSAFLYTTAKDRKEIKKIVQAVAKRMDSLPEDKRKLFRIIDRAELDKMGADSAAILALAAAPGLVFSGGIAPANPVNMGPGTKLQSTMQGLFFETSGGHHGYDPNIPDMFTGFIAVGAGIDKGKKIDEIIVVDIAPLIAKLLGIQFTSPDGKLVPGILR